MTDITIIARKEDEDDRGIEERLKEEHLIDQSSKAREFFSNIQSELEAVEGDLKNGISYLDMKNDILLSYMIDLCNIILRKVRGETISGHTSVERCVTYRVMLEKMKAIDQRLAYQLNKMISVPDDAIEEEQGININNLDLDVESSEDQSDDDDDDEDTGDENDGESNKKEKKRSKVASRNTNPNNGDEDEEEESDSNLSNNAKSDEDGQNQDDGLDDELNERLRRNKLIADRKEERRKERQKKVKSGLYKPRKLRSVAYDEDDHPGSRDRRRRDYSEFYQDDENYDIVEESVTREDSARTRYEEENYTRLPDDNPKKIKRKLKEKAGKTKKGSKSKRFRR